MKLMPLLVCTIVVFGLAIPSGICQGDTSAKELQDAVYRHIESRTYMKNWLIVGPFPIDIALITFDEAGRSIVANDDNNENTPLQKAAFDYDFLLDHGGESEIEPQADMAHIFDATTYRWHLYNNRWRTIDLQRVFKDWKIGDYEHEMYENSVTYAYAEIDMPEEHPAILGIGSDDGIKIWLNGQLVHENFVGRECSSDDDIVDVTFAEGSNRLLLKIENMTRDYGFICRYYDVEDAPFVNIAGNRIQTPSDNPRKAILMFGVFGIAAFMFVVIAIIASLQKRFDL